MVILNLWNGNWSTFILKVEIHSKVKLNQGAAVVCFIDDSEYYLVSRFVDKFTYIHRGQLVLLQYNVPFMATKSSRE